MNATHKLRIATYLRRLADRLNPPAAVTVNYTGVVDGVHIYTSTTSAPAFTWSIPSAGR